MRGRAQVPIKDCGLLKGREQKVVLIYPDAGPVIVGREAKGFKFSSEANRHISRRHVRVVATDDSLTVRQLGNAISSERKGRRTVTTKQAGDELHLDHGDKLCLAPVKKDNYFLVTRHGHNEATAVGTTSKSRVSEALGAGRAPPQAAAAAAGTGGLEGRSVLIGQRVGRVWLEDEDTHRGMVEFDD